MQRTFLNGLAVDAGRALWVGPVRQCGSTCGGERVNGALNACL
jgi:hypothetical protein